MGEPTKKVAKQVADKDQKETETRGMDAYIRRGNITEYRDIVGDITDGNAVEDTAGNGGVTAPVTVNSQIIAKLDEEAPVFQAVRHFPSQRGSLKLPRETDVAEAGFVGEGVDVKGISTTLGTVKLNQKRVGASVQLTNDLLNDSAVDVLTYSTQRLGRAMARAIEKAILTGAATGQDADESFHPIIGDKGVKTATYAGTVEDLIQFHNSLNPAYLAGAMWVVSREQFDVITKLKDGDGRYLVLNNMIGDVPGYTLLGSRIFVSDALKGAKSEIVFGNFNEGYGLMVKQGMNLKHVTDDTKQALSGGHLIVLDAYMDGAVINPDAFVIVAPKA